MSAVKTKETLKMDKLRQSGMTFREIADLYGISIATTWQRLFRAGFIDNSRGAAPEEINKEQLTNLYAVERLSLKEISSFFAVRVDLIKAALNLYDIPVRRILRRTENYINLLEKLKVGDEIKIHSASRKLDARLYKTAKRLGIKISLRTVGDNVFKVTRVKEVNNKPVPLYQRIDKNRLEKLYLAQELSIEKIAPILGHSKPTIANALQYHKIPKRPPRKFGGKIVDALRSLVVGEQTEINSAAKRPVINLHAVAKLNGLKISVRSLGDGRFRVKRVEEVNEKGVPLHRRIDKSRLEHLYLEEKLSTEEIGDILGCSRVTIREALAYNKIPKRLPIAVSGSRVDVLRNLAIGEETEISCEVQHPIINLQTIAGRIGIKISIKTLGDGKFRIKRLE